MKAAVEFRLKALKAAKVNQIDRRNCISMAESCQFRQKTGHGAMRIYYQVNVRTEIPERCKMSIFRLKYLV